MERERERGGRVLSKIRLWSRYMIVKSVNRVLNVQKEDNTT